MNQLPELRDSLVRAAARQSEGVANSKVPRRRRAIARRLPAVLASAVAIAVAVIVVTSLRAPTQRSAATSSATLVDQHLRSILAVLRRPQTAYDLQVLRQSDLERPMFAGAIDAASARVATITPWGTRVLLVLATGNSSGGTFMFEQGGLIVEESHGFGCCGTVASIEAGHDEMFDGWGRSFAGGSTGFRFYQVIPDGVSRVTFVIPRDSSPGQYGAPVYRSPRYVTVPVRGNIAAIEETDRQCCALTMPEIWYAADGHVVKRIGDFAAVNRVTSAPRPGPQTARSLAAERDPSTPNPVWVSPAVGGPHTNFTIHFRVLLNGADYHYRFTGTRCPGYTFSGGSGKPNALNGSLWSDGVGAVEFQALCPGTYHVAVSVTDLGRAGSIRAPVKPFGVATFVVR